MASLMKYGRQLSKDIFTSISRRSISITGYSSTKSGIQIRSCASQASPKKALLMDANGIVHPAPIFSKNSIIVSSICPDLLVLLSINFSPLCLIMVLLEWIVINPVYRRNQKKLVALAKFLQSTNRYPLLSAESFKMQDAMLATLKEDANCGKITSEQYYLTLLSVLNVNPVDFSGALNAIRRAEFNITIFPAAEETLKALKGELGVRLAVVTDSMASTVEKKAWMATAGLEPSIFDVVVNSSDVGVTKPNPLIYTRALADLKVEPQDAVFLGHRKSELDGAKQLGMSTIVMYPDPELRENGGKLMGAYDFYVPGWHTLLSVPIWPSKKSKTL